EIISASNIRNKIDANENIYLPVLRSEQLSHDELLFSESNNNKEKYYKDMIDRSNVCVVDLTDSDTGLNMELKYAITTKKPILALAQKDKGYDVKYDKILKNVIGYSSEAEFRYFVEVFAKNYEGKIYNDKVDNIVVVGILRDPDDK
ncbi:MAG: hypothetical protein K5666_04830, partial [Bacilli bacterium]|nr:hypothetical protein [Bacilli bacterium]